MKKIFLVFSLVIFSSVSIPLTAHAQNKEKVIQSLDLGSEALDGELMGPNGDFMSGRKISIMNSLIQFRDNFIEEMIRSAEDL